MHSSKSLSLNSKLLILLYFVLVVHLSLVVSLLTSNKRIFNSTTACEESDCVVDFNGTCNDSNATAVTCQFERIDPNATYTDVTLCRATGCLTLGLHCKELGPNEFKCVDTSM